MKKLLFLLVLGGIFGTGCASQEKGCPSSNYYSSKNVKQNKRSARQMSSRVF